LKTRILGSHGFRLDLKTHKIYFLTSAQIFTRNQAQKHYIWSMFQKKKICVNKH
jgi:hypothetical protein